MCFIVTFHYTKCDCYIRHFSRCAESGRRTGLGIGYFSKSENRWIPDEPRVVYENPVKKALWKFFTGKPYKMKWPTICPVRELLQETDEYCDNHYSNAGRLQRRKDAARNAHNLREAQLRAEREVYEESKAYFLCTLCTKEGRNPPARIRQANSGLCCDRGYEEFHASQKYKRANTSMQYGQNAQQGVSQPRATTWQAGEREPQTRPRTRLAPQVDESGYNVAGHRGAYARQQPIQGSRDLIAEASQKPPQVYHVPRRIEGHARAVQPPSGHASTPYLHSPQPAPTQHLPRRAEQGAAVPTVSGHGLRRSNARAKRVGHPGGDAPAPSGTRDDYHPHDPGPRPRPSISQVERSGSSARPPPTLYNHSHDAHDSYAQVLPPGLQGTRYKNPRPWHITLALDD